ncbi:MULTISPECIES: TetR/AcrR family transcriptional regulator C-terminal domain-containing protein [Actinoalloteichus]|uniref:Transcriptional regulator, TetR family n=1 Tax=Actinoalloteichus fjordicus TaxID=1612552 RepID=A0AAC9LED2_9PSEU|nr:MULTISPECIES: TetR/AcrR family transcriptional regulator C-terminal domain-containing protein [Actinoalloteichus]APU14770.1 transcriptional regulator, TetR family [Actinoalloteichus fjordicus]APU20741.1 transcriptional regulator, TetR family [Actinoalloteichus sp. GBA129-24]
MARPRQPRLSRARIVEAATVLIDADGLDAFSTRRLALELGVRGPSLYNHFATKNEILDAVADEIIAQVDVSFFAEHDWRTALRRWAHSYRDALAAHPNIVPVLARGPGRRPAALAMADAVYGGLVDAGWPPARATHIGAVMRYVVAGSALGSFARGFEADPALYEEERYPHLSQAHLLADHQRSVDEGAFALGVDMLLAGLSQVYAEVVGPLPPAAGSSATGGSATTGQARP